MTIRLFHPLPLLFLLLWGTGCAEKPRSVGGSLIDPNDLFTVADTTVTAVSDTSYTVPLLAGNGVELLTGRASAADEFVTLIRFNDVSYVDSLIGATIDTAQLRLYVTSYADRGALPVRLGVYEALQGWKETTFTNDSIGAFAVGAVPFGVFSDSANAGSDLQTLLDTAAVRRMVTAMTDTNAMPFHGFAVRAEPGGMPGTFGIYSFNAGTSVMPRLLVKYTKNGVRDSLILYTGEDTYGARFTVPPVLAPFEVRGGYGVRSSLRFDLSWLKDRPIVAGATLTLVADTAASRRSIFSPDSVVALLGLSGASADASDSSVFVIGTAAYDSAVGKTYVFSLREITQRWVNGIYVNEGLRLRPSYETSYADRIVFHPADHPVAAKRPKLHIIYSSK